MMRVKGRTELLKTYAALDGCSTSCFINSNLLSQLGVRGEPHTLTLTTMQSDRASVSTRIVNNLEIYDLNCEQKDYTSVVYAKPNWPFCRDNAPNPDDTKHLTYLKNAPFKYIDADIGLLIGMNFLEIIKLLAVVDGPHNQPYATLHIIGWALNGPLASSEDSTCLRVNVNMENIENELSNFYSPDFKDSHAEEIGLSRDDIKWQEKVNGSIKLNAEGHCEIALPFRAEPVSMPNNEEQIYSSFIAQKQRLLKDRCFFEDYCKYMKLMEDNRYVEKVPDAELNVKLGLTWDLNHHGVYHKQKRKLKVVFNCSLKFKSVSSNDKLLQGPHLTNSLLGGITQVQE